MGFFKNNNNNNAVMGAQNGNNNEEEQKRSVAFAKAKRDKAIAFAATGVDIERLLEAIGGAEDDGNGNC
ncbi:hypothetical protein [Bacillus sp. Marseille-Q3570]|uniref:hypothetical protein n=1 Tax=Bacillus sp. Marseille-Q3570 TaxID=2963522 RepID=UPI0021B7A0F1|nr:hypothetical protein [Bacillus sp. Marseille-Q3570]